MFNQIKADMITAMKNHEKENKDCLSLLIGRLKNKAIELRVDYLDNAECIRIIQKFIKELEEERTGFITAGRQETADKLARNIELISKYLPKMMSEAEISAVISQLEDRTIPAVMKHFKTNYQGKVDMGLVSKIAKSML